MMNQQITHCSLHSWLQHPYLAMLLRVILGGVLIYAGSQKLFDMGGFAESLENYRMLPIAVINVVAIILPPIEMLLGICLIFGILFDGTLTAVTVLFAIFLFSVQQALIRDLNIECGCFGTETGTTIGLQAVIRNSFLLLGVIPIWLWHLSNDAAYEPVPPENDDPLSAKVETSAGDGA